MTQALAELTTPRTDAAHNGSVPTLREPSANPPLSTTKDIEKPSARLPSGSRRCNASRTGHEVRYRLSDLGENF